MSKTVRDRFWLWGHPENSCRSFTGKEHGQGYPPAVGARYLGVRNIYYVAFGNAMNIAACAGDMDGIAKTGLAVERWGDPDANPVDKTFSLAPLFPNLDRMIWDDFFNGGNPKHIQTWNDRGIPYLRATRDRLHAAGLSMWVVLYQHQLDMPIGEYLDVFDGVSFWFWNEPDKAGYHEHSRRFLELTPGKRRQIGCYLFNFGLLKEADAAMVRYQLDQNLDLMREGKTEGVILHNNDLQGLGFEAYEEAKTWLSLHGDETLG